MGQRRPERQLSDARMAYLSAARRAVHALGRFDNSGMAMDPGPDPLRPIEWTPEQRQTIRRTAHAFAEVLERREEWDGLRRDLTTWR